MLADIFWTVATSTGALMIIGGVALIAFAVGHIPLASLLPVIGPYVVLARFVAIVAAALLTFLVGFRVSDERAEMQRLKTELAWSENQLEQQKATAADAERLKGEAQQHAGELAKKVNGYEAFLKGLPADGCGFTDADLDWLRGIAR